VAHHLASLGYEVALLARNTKKLDALKKEILASTNVKVSVYTVDVTDRLAVTKAVAQVVATHQQIDVLFNNAGIVHRGTSELEVEKFKQMIEVNLMGAFYVLQAVVAQIKKQQSGYIFNLVSRSAIVARSVLGGYAASKFALRGFSEALANELASEGIKVTALHPGWVATEMSADISVPPEEMLQVSDIAQLVESLLKLSRYAHIRDILIEPAVALTLTNPTPTKE
jgi:short-subunit dehydrogenase